MTWRGTVESFLSRYGEPVAANGVPARAVVRPLLYRSGAKLNLPKTYYDDLHYLYTGPAEEKLTVGDRVEAASRSYVVKRSDTASLGGEELYVWAVLKELAPDADLRAYLLCGGVKCAEVDGYRVETVQQSRAVTAWGEQESAGVAGGSVSYALSLSGVRPLNGTDLHALKNFSLAAERADGRTVYSGCEWKSITDEGGAGNRMKQDMEAIAARRTTETGAF